MRLYEGCRCAVLDRSVSLGLELLEAAMFVLRRLLDFGKSATLIGELLAV